LSVGGTLFGPASHQLNPQDATMQIAELGR